MRIAAFSLSGNSHDRRKQFRRRWRKWLTSNPDAKAKRKGSKVEVSIVVPGKMKKAK